MKEMNNVIRTAMATAISNCSNNVSIEELENLSSETITTCNLSELLSQKKQEVKQLEATIAECEQAKEKAEAQEKAKAKAKQEAEEKFLSSLSNSEREALNFLEGIGTLATNENKKLVNMLANIYANCNANTELVLTARLASYVTILITENQKDTIDLLEKITLKVDNIQCNTKAGSVNTRLSRFERILLSVQDLY